MSRLCKVTGQKRKTSNHLHAAKKMKAVPYRLAVNITSRARKRELIVMSEINVCLIVTDLFKFWVSQWKLSHNRKQKYQNQRAIVAVFYVPSHY